MKIKTTALAVFLLMTTPALSQNAEIPLEPDFYKECSAFLGQGCEKFTPSLKAEIAFVARRAALTIRKNKLVCDSITSYRFESRTGLGNPQRNFERHCFGIDSCFRLKCNHGAYHYRIHFVPGGNLVYDVVQ